MSRHVIFNVYDLYYYNDGTRNDVSYYSSVPNISLWKVEDGIVYDIFQWKPNERVLLARSQDKVQHAYRRYLLSLITDEPYYW